MENTKKPKLCILGASHARRLYYACKENTYIISRYDVIGNVQSGATWQTFKFNDKMLGQLSKDDVLVVQFLGNDLLKRNISITPNPKTIHLLKFVPQPDSYVQIVRGNLKEKLKNLQCRIFMIDDPYRHLKCCEEHHNPGLLGYLSKRNKELHDFFSEYIVLDHRRLCSLPFRKLKCMSYYAGLLEDKVHFKNIIYKAWAEFLYERLTK